MFLLCSNCGMADRPASWRMPTPKQMEKLAAEAARKSANSAAAPDAALPAEYWEALLKDERASVSDAQMRQRRLSEISRHVLRISCRRCVRTLEIQTVDAVRLYGGNTMLKDAARRLLDDTCQQRTGRYEEDGCWPSFDAT
jgi:NMD protein affecting ribosome stability and mRNA decay